MRRGANSQSGCATHFFCRKLHENERIWSRGGGGGMCPGAHLDLPMLFVNSTISRPGQKQGVDSTTANASPEFY